VAAEQIAPRVRRRFAVAIRQPAMLPTALVRGDHEHAVIAGRAHRVS